ncbi:DUF4041 domain-containing protein [Prochlorococcus sp. MIT 1306]|uniref:DUF4041 domain-containing protein n=1 Tax=Prochlorococcus sp. MIT 1306 TaxID=1799667 RepID=UPI0007B34CA2|nr:DUF4041 domain-containing protein [Prochlorococcus sp. MIT 1306]KZR63156.1 T5orf172 domain protein [Prochlorococcus sp. MIT 1306]
MLKAISIAGLTASAALTISAAVVDGRVNKNLGVLGGISGFGSAVSALVASTATDRKYSKIIDAEAEAKRLVKEAQSRVDGLHRQLAHIERSLDNANRKFKERTSKAAALEQEREAVQFQIQEAQDTLDELTQLIKLENSLNEAGFAARRYIGMDSTALTIKLKSNREQQKDLGKELLEECKRTTWTVDGSVVKGKAHVKQTMTALLRGFNGECDAAISTLKHSNDSTVLGKLEKVYNFYEKKAEQQHIPWSSHLWQLKEDEAHIVHDNELAKHAEKQEQAEIRRQMREEERAQREMEKVQEEAEREAAKYADLLEKARKEAYSESEEGAHLDKIAELERRLTEAEENHQRAMSRAQLTRSGHVYVISNIGSFGQNIYKVGMTRRLEPIDRVRELGDASVPFPFDVHAMIFTEDAPGLEKAIHKRIDEHRLNLVNLRREFFSITLAELQEEAEAAAREIGVTAEVRWTLFAEAEQYRQSVSEREGAGLPERAEMQSVA